MQKFRELMNESSARGWSLQGGNRLVKVCSPTAARKVEQSGRVAGYVTQEKFLYGMTPSEIERALGLRPFELGKICYVYALARLPVAGEFDYHFSTAFPKGLPFDDADDSTDMQALMQARKDFQDGRDLYRDSMTPVVQVYPPGSRMIDQWTIRPIDVGGLVATVTASFPFSRPNGSLKRYSPHNRGDIR